MDQLPALEKLIQNFMAIQKLTLTQSPQSDISDIIFSFFLSFSLSSGKCLEEERNVKKKKKKEKKRGKIIYIYINISGNTQNSERRRQISGIELALTANHQPGRVDGRWRAASLLHWNLKYGVAGVSHRKPALNIINQPIERGHSSISSNRSSSNSNEMKWKNQNSSSSVENALGARP